MNGLMARIVFRSIALCFVAGVCAVRGDEVVTSGGSRLVGQIVKVHADSLVIATDFAGEITVAREKVVSCSTDRELAVSLTDGRLLHGRYMMQEGQVRIEATDGQNTVSPELIGAVFEKGAADPSAPPPEPRREWSYEAVADLAGKTGNSERFAVGGGFTATLEGPKDRLMLYVSGRSAEEDGQKSEDEIVGGIDFESRIGKRHSWYARTELEKDRIEGLDLRSTVAAGYGYYVLERPEHVLRLRVGLQYQYESYEDGRTEEAPGLDAGLHHMIKLFDWGKIVTDAVYTPSFEDFGDYVIHHESALDVPLGKSDMWSLRVGVANDYTSTPPEGVERLDTLYFARLVLNWQ